MITAISVAFAIGFIGGGCVGALVGYLIVDRARREDTGGS